jgi:hypothetical protein
MKNLIFIYCKLFSLCIAGAATVKIWVIFVRVWMHGGHYQWGWIDAKFIIANGGLLAIVFCIIATIACKKSRP